MPTYRYRCTCGGLREVIKKIAQINDPVECPRCQSLMDRQICAPAVQGDYPGYECPVTGAWIEGRAAHEENLRKTGHRLLEPGELAANEAARKRQEAEFDSSVERTVGETVSAMDTENREALASALENKLDASYTRSTPNVPV